MPFPWLAAATAASAASSLFGAKQSQNAQEESNAANAQIARENRDWQEKMDNSKYQRGVEDARKAGFNPLVAFPGSAGTPMPSTPVNQSTAPNRGELALATSKAISDILLTREMASTEKTKQDLNRAETTAKGGSVGIPGLFNIPLRGLFGLGGSTSKSIKNSTSPTLPSTFGGGFRLGDLFKKGGKK